MTSKQKDLSKEKLTSLILDAGLLEEFLKWYREKVGMHIDNIKLNSVDYELLYQFAQLKRLIDTQEDNLPEVEYSEILSPGEKSRMIKKMRSKNNNTK